MSRATFWVNRAEVRTDPPSCVLIGEVRSGTIVAGMRVAVPLNGLTDISVRVTKVIVGSASGEIALSLECGSAEDAETLAALNLDAEEVSVAD
jgi:hypothetical protein